ncbi:hypothetical protein O3M35_009738 [Rhynocoris fuscipes]|uniref:Odorant receptor n=1 Tax=Rhynocoris fuscipes TaxID=488301 RepID=A0AAW1D6X8_9HEMI
MFELTGKISWDISGICKQNSDDLFQIPQDVSPYKLIYYEMRIGAYMSKDGKPWSLIYSIFTVILNGLFGVLAVLEVILGNNELKELILAFSTVTIFVQVYAKLLVMLSNEDKVRVFLRELEEYRSELLDDEQYEHEILKADRYSKISFMCFNAFYLGFPMVSFVSNFIDDSSNDFKQPHLTHKLWMPWSYDEFWSYCMTTFIVLVMTLSTLVIYCPCVAFHLTFTSQMSAYIKILQHRLEYKGLRDESIYMHHKKINQFLQDYNKLFTGLLLVEITGASLQPIGFGYTLIKDFKRNKRPPLDMFYNLTMLLMGPFLLCFCGQEISTQMERLHESSYMSDWYEEKPLVRRDLYTTMLVTVRPMTLNYKLFVTFNFECYSKIAQGIYSYLMMINNLETAD